MDLIVTHNNADFDAFSSLVAAQRLYPGARLLMPGSQERAVREFLSLVGDKIKIESERTCDLRDVKRLVLVDTRHRSRIGVAATIVDKPSVEVHIYDHHPRNQSDIKGDKDVFREIGATVSMLIDILRSKNKAKFTALEATIMLLGIYEETGSLTYRTTTRSDVDAVSFLLSRGANLQAVSSYLNRKLTEEELTFLTTLISGTKVLAINGVNVAIAHGEIKRFLGELGTIVRKLQDVENFPVLFVLFKTGNKLRIIARSRLKEVDVNRILKQFGGGGHRSAASAKIEGMDAESFTERLVTILKSSIKTRSLARDIMSSPVKTISSDRKIIDASEMLGRLKMKGMPVMENKSLVGVITTSDINKALKHHYEHAPVKGYMTRTVLTIRPNTPLHQIQKTMFEEGVGRLPVVRGKTLVGIVTRTDVLKSVHRDIFKGARRRKTRGDRMSLSREMKRVLPKKMLNILQSIGRCANNIGYRVFVVGGFVRDMLLGAKNFDIDVVVEGDAILFGRKIADLFNGSFVAFKKFGTSKVVMDWPSGMCKTSGSGPKFKMDFATARKESYEKPAALPTVEFSLLKDDMHRRDFTINAMAISLNKGSFGQLIDFFGGERDLENGVIRVLHDGSFIDDPTRIFRAVRFEQRFGFPIDRYTGLLIKNAVKEEMFSKTQNHRISDELVLILREDSPAKAIKRMKELHELRFIHKKLKFTRSTGRLFSKVKSSFYAYDKSPFKKRHVDLWLMYLMALLQNMSLKDTREICDKFAFRRSDKLRLLSAKKNCKKIRRLLAAKRVPPAKVYGLLEPLSLEEILLVRAQTDSRLLHLRIREYFEKHCGVAIRMGGEDLKRMGLEPGPMYKEILTKVLHHKVDGNLRTKREELQYAKRLIK
ncbi:MAG: CBS domain-containing protein [Candidatus Omnitrophota bacterium]